MGGTLAKYSDRAEIRLILISNGEKGKIAVCDADQRAIGCRRPNISEVERFVAARQTHCVASARILGIRQVEFLGLADSEPPLLLVPALLRRIREFNPHVILSLNEAGTTMHSDHSWSAIATYRAILTLLERVYGDVSALHELPFHPPFALRRYFTYTLVEASRKFDYWAELNPPLDELTHIGVQETLARKRQSALAYVNQAHWLTYFERVDVQDLPFERFLERVAIGPSARGADDLLGALDRPSLDLRLSPLPEQPHRYTSSDVSFYADLLDRVERCRRQSMRAVILASGHGKRMNNPSLPKSLEPILDKPLIRYIIEAIQDAEVDDMPLILVGPRGDKVREELGPEFTYVNQGEPRGTGHAVSCFRDELTRLDVGHVLVLYGDMPLINPDTIRALATRHLEEQAAITMGTLILPDFEDWRRFYRSFGRIVRSEGGRVERIAEFKDASEEERQITEVNPSFFCFQADWLWENVHRLGADNAQGEYYLTDLIALAVRQQQRIVTLAVAPEEALGVNTREDLAFVELLLSRRPPKARRQIHEITG